MQDFSDYVTGIRTENNNPLGTILNGHTTFLMSDAKNRETIKDQRMQWYINNYMLDRDIQGVNDAYVKYYQKYLLNGDKNIEFNPPPCFYNEMIREQRRNEEMVERESFDDINIHYEELHFRHVMNLNTYRRRNREYNVDDTDTNDIINVISDNEEMESNTDSDNESDYDDTLYDVEYADDQYDDFDEDEEEYDDNYDW